MTRLVAYGCSHTAGSELADHIMLDTDIKTCDELKRKYLSQGDTIPQAWEKMWKKFGFSVDPYDLFDQIWKTVKLKEIPFLDYGEDLNRSLTWVRYLAELRGHTAYMNMGQGGGSLEQCLYLLERNIAEGEVDPVLDEVIVQVPHPYRWIEFTKEGKVGTFYGYEIANYFNISWTYFQLLRHLKFLGVKYFFIEAPAWRLQADMKADHPIETDDSNRNILASVERWWQWIETNAIPTNDEFTPSPRLGGNHYFTETQKEIATHLSVVSGRFD